MYQLNRGILLYTNLVITAQKLNTAFSQIGLGYLLFNK